MADYIEPVKIEELPDKESLENSDFFIAEDSEDTKKLTFEVLKKYVNDTVTIYFGLSSDAWKAPTHDITESAILGKSILGQMLLGNSAEWNTEFPTALNHDDYIWVSFYVEHPNGETEWTTPFCLMDQDAKETIIEIQKELEKVNEKLSNMINQFYPVGSIYVSVNGNNPSDLFGGEWQSVDATFLLASGTDDIYMWKRIS